MLRYYLVTPASVKSEVLKKIYEKERGNSMRMEETA
jgi:hypothetical protein